MDETCIRCFETLPSGNVFLPRGDRMEQVVPARKRMLCLTLIAMVCDDARIQSKLPQVLVGNERTLRLCDLPAIVGACGPDVVAVRCLAC